MRNIDTLQSELEELVEEERRKEQEYKFELDIQHRRRVESNPDDTPLTYEVRNHNLSTCDTDTMARESSTPPAMVLPPPTTTKPSKKRKPKTPKKKKAKTPSTASRKRKREQ